MSDYTRDFELDPAHVWLNTASEGPIPKAAAAALQQAVTWKMSPDRLTLAKFQQIPLELKQSIGRLINVPGEDIILGNSATYGVHLLANGLPLRSGDEIVLMRNDFPTDILPWLHLAQKGIKVHQLKGEGAVLTIEDIKAAVTGKTKVVCLPHVHSFSGYVLDIETIGDFCREKKIAFIVNISQSAGSFPVNVGAMPIDAVVCAGYKWLLGPYGTGFCWMTKALREQLDYPQAYWISLMNERSLSTQGELSLPDGKTARRYDVFGTANFFNFVPWKASIEYLLNVGMEHVAAHNRTLVDIFVKKLDFNKYVLDLPNTMGSNIVAFSYQDPARNAGIFEYLNSKNIHLALWKNKLRVSPHLFNTMSDIHRTVDILNTYV